MFYECAISPEALFEIAIDRRNYRDFIKGFSTGGNFLYSELPKLKRNKKQLLGLLNANHSELQKKQLEDLIIFSKIIRLVGFMIMLLTCHGQITSLL